MNYFTVNRTGSVSTLSLHHPPANFLTTDVLIELSDHLDALDRDPRVRAVVLASSIPDVFASHYDVGELLSYAPASGISIDPVTARMALGVVSTIGKIPGLRAVLRSSQFTGVMALLRYHSIIERMRSSSIVFVAAVDGTAFGGGLELALACDIRLITESSKVGLPEVAIGIMPGAGGIQSLLPNLGMSRTLELVLTARPLDAEEAVRLGIFHTLTTPDALLAAAQDVAEQISSRPAALVRAIKGSVYRHDRTPHRRAARFEQSEFMSLMSKRSARTAMEQYARDIADLETIPAATPFGERLYEQVLSHWIQGRRPAEHYPSN
ncbi:MULTISPECIES: enoyl-CoA hydratase/isomerase family protein [unclassified Mycobacterium]|uniref:enoyl-CoA hydratase/isomerase family protein n=1 Tax=unclassified Mycobacterium TaxID=2642494 RepID=UPI0029C8D1E3|nr:MULTISPECIES: enoyl-CoA hydratase/isomerase family protein [unclassified Mycobacterium]